MDATEARETLRQLEDRLSREVADMVKVLRADIPTHIVRAVRQVFERSPEADGLDEAALKALKADTDGVSQALTSELCDQLSDVAVWRWDSAWELPTDPDGLDGHPRLAEVLGKIPAAIGELLERNGLPNRDPDAHRYRTPAYFVAGSFMKSLVANFWRALSDHHELEAKLVEVDQTDAREARRTRWDSV